MKLPQKAEEITDEPVLCLLMQLGLMLSALPLWLTGLWKAPTQAQSWDPAHR